MIGRNEGTLMCFRMATIMVLFVAIQSCAPTNRAVRRHLSHSEKQLHHHAGFVLFDPAKGKTLVDFQGDRYYTPASNTKVFTLYAALKLLGDSIPALRYQYREDTLVFWGTGDPSLLYRELTGNSKVYDFLRGHTGPLVYSGSNDFTQRFGPGWSYEDYQESFCVERTAFPIYGNRALFYMRNNKPGVIPKRFESAIEISSDTSSERKTGRQWDENHFMIYPKLRTEAEVPFISGQTLSTQLLADTLGRTVITGRQLINDKVTTLYSIPSDSLYRLLMQESDNFVAEQLLLLCASQLADSLDTDIALRFLRAELSDLPDTFRIVDGSGLSRYNLVTPRTMVALWQKIRSLTTDARLFSILPAGGVSGTIRNSYRAEKPFVYAKTGTLTGVHCLSGMIFTKSNRMLIFAYMNTNYTVPLREVRSSMEELLFKIRNNY